jgi:hypothetical protein
VAQRKPAERHQDGIFSALDSFGRRQRYGDRQALAPVREQGQNIRPAGEYERACGARIWHLRLDRVGGKFPWVCKDHSMLRHPPRGGSIAAESKGL